MGTVGSRASWRPRSAFAASSAFGAEDGAWSVSKSSGEVWMTTTGAQQASLKHGRRL